MKKYILLFLLIPTLAQAEMFVCHDKSGVITEKHQGDCMTLGICSDYNNQGMREGCFEATKEEYDLADRFATFDGNIVDGSRVVRMKQAEIDAILAAEQAAQEQAEKEAKKSIFDTDEWQVALKVLLQEAKSSKTVEQVTTEIKAEIDAKAVSVKPVTP